MPIDNLSLYQKILGIKLQVDFVTLKMIFNLKKIYILKMNITLLHLKQYNKEF